MADNESPVPDLYADQMRITTTVWGAALTFGKLPAHPVFAPGQPPLAEPQVTVRMSLQHAKIMAMILRRNLKAWENENMEIAIPQAVYEDMKLAPDDW